MEARRVALITGASSGIGLATAERLLQEGLFVILTARSSSLARFEKMEFLQRHAGAFWVRALDVTSGKERRYLIDEIEQQLGRLDVLINNAGVVYRTPIEFAYDFECQEQMNVNFHAPIELIKVTLPLMRKQGHGRIINISSAAGFFSVPTMGIYAASKHALEGASEALFQELKPWNISVTLIQPGFVTSDTYEKTRLGIVMETRRRATTAIYAAQLSTISALIGKSVRLTTAQPSHVASSIWKVIQATRPPLRQPATLDAQVFSFLKRFLPDAGFERLISFCLAKIGGQLPKDKGIDLLPNI
jgi:short-subunit dehydrogenase